MAVWSVFSILVLAAAGWSSVVGPPSGDVWWMRGGNPLQLGALAAPAAGDRIEVKKGGFALFSSRGLFVSFEGSGVVVFEEGGAWRTEGGLKASQQAMPDKALAAIFGSEPVSSPGIGDFRSGLLAQLSYPVAVAVEEQSPVFRWREGIVGSIRLKDKESTKVLWQSPVSGAETSYPDGEPPLARGGVFCWELINAKGATIEEACFRVVSEEESKQFSVIRQSIGRKGEVGGANLCLAAASFLLRAERVPAAADVLEGCGGTPWISTARASLRKRLGL